MPPDSVETPPEPCKKCGGTGEMDPPEKVRVLFGEHKFVCDRCAGAKTEPPPP